MDPNPAVPSATDDTIDPLELTPTKFRHMNTFTALHTVIMATTQHVPAKMILDSGAGISGVGEQWKLTDISRISSMSIQGAFGDSFAAIHSRSPWTWEATCCSRAWNEG